jgi:hypothetical protein
VIARVRRFLDSRRLLAWAVAIGVLLAAPSLFGGFQTEDWVFRASSRSEPFSLPWRVNLWGPERLDEEARRAIVLEGKRVGTLPWLTDDTFHVSLWRPLASWTHHLEYRLYPDAAVPMHAQNLLWYALLVAGLGLCYRRLFRARWAGALATLLYAIDDAHGHAVGWITNRSALMAAAFAVFALYSFDRFRRDGWRHGAWLTPASFTLALSSSELALGAVGYFVAHAVLLDRDRPAGRVLAALAWLAPLAAWAVLYRLLGHGATGSGMYIDPLVEPLAFLRQGLERASMLVWGELGVPPSDLYGELHGGARSALAIAAGLLALALAFLLAPVVKADRVAAFFGLGLLLAIVPACAVFPEDRLLLLAGVGGSGLVASVLLALVEKTAPARRLGAVAVALVVVHALIAPLLLPLRSLTMWRYDRRLAEARDSAFELINAPDQELVLLNAPDFYFGVMLFLTRTARSESLPANAWCLSGSLEPLTVKRLDPVTIELLPERGFMSEQLNHVYRNEARPMRAGELVFFDEFKARVTELDERGQPRRAKFRFRWPLDDRRMVFAAWRGGRYQRVQPPAHGELLRLRP